LCAATSAKKIKSGYSYTGEGLQEDYQNNFQEEYFYQSTKITGFNAITKLILTIFFGPLLFIFVGITHS
jgi:hypothetical protein